MTAVRFLHVAAVALFVGGQLALSVAIAPVLRDRHDEMRAIARRFGIASAAALVVIVVTGISLASEYQRWDDPVLHGKLAVLCLVFVLTGLHIASSRTRAIQVALLTASLVTVWLGAKLSHG